MKLTKTGSQARGSESQTLSMEGGEGAAGGLGGSGWPLAALATLRGNLAGTVQGPVTNHSHRSSDSAPREASVLVPPEPLPPQGPRHRQLCPRGICAKSQPPPTTRVQINWGGCHIATHLRPGNATAALSGNQHPSSVTHTVPCTPELSAPP